MTTPKVTLLHGGSAHPQSIPARSERLLPNRVAQKGRAIR